MVGEAKKAIKVSMELMASLAQARAKVEAGVVSKADQQALLFGFILQYYTICFCDTNR